MWGEINLVQEKDMLTSNREKYLGDIISSDCKINANVEERYNKGIGIANQILSLLKEISFGEHYFEMAVQAVYAYQQHSM